MAKAKKTEKKEQTLYRMNVDKEFLAKGRKTIAILLALSTATYVAMGRHNCQCFGDIAVFVSWLSMIVPIVLAWLGVYRFGKMGEHFTLEELKNGPDRIRRNVGYLTMIAFAALFCGFWFVFTGEYVSLAAELGMVALMVFMCALGVAQIYMVKKYVITSENDVYEV